MNILVTGIGGPTPRSITRHLRKIYPNAVITGVDTNPKALGFFMEGLLDNRLVVPRADDASYWDSIKKVISDYSIELAFVQPEMEIIEWGNYFQENGNYPVPVVLPSVKWSVPLVDKGKMSELLKDTHFIPKTISISPSNPKTFEVQEQIGYPCWIRATVGSGGLGSLKLDSEKELLSWLKIHHTIPEFTISEFLTGRHFANQMLYVNGTLKKNAALECVEYVMADVAPSKVTGNTSFGRFLNQPDILDFCSDCMDFLKEKIGVEPHGVFSFDLKEDAQGNLKVTEINVRHMAYTGVMAKVGYDLIADSVNVLKGDEISTDIHHTYPENDLVFLRDVDIEPIVVRESEFLA